MSNEDKIREILGKHFSGYQPELPENDWKNFRNKISRGRGKVKLYNSLALGFLLSVLIVLNLIDNGIVHSLLNDKKETTPVHKNLVKNQSLKSTNQASVKINNNNGIKENISVKHDFVNSNPPLTIDQNSISHLQKTEVTNQTRNNLPETPDPDRNILKNIKTNDSVNEKKPVVNTDHLSNRKNDSVHVPDLTQSITNQNTHKFHPVFYLKLIASADYTFNKIKIDPKYQPEIHEDYALIRNKSEKNDWGFTLGANLEVFLNDRLSATSGFFYTETHTSGKYDFYNTKIPVVDTATGIILGYINGKDSIGVHQNINDRYSYLEIPLIFNYSVFEKKGFSAGFKAGVDLVYCLSVKGTVISQQALNVTSLSSNSFRTFNAGTVAGINLRYKINDRYILSFEPDWKKYWSSVYKKSEKIDEKPSSLSLNAALLIRLK